MPRATRSGNTPKATAKTPSKKKTPTSKVAVSTKSEPRSKGGRQSTSENSSAKTPTRSLRKREIPKSKLNSEESEEEIEMLSPSPVSSKRRRVSGSSANSSITPKTSHSKPTPPTAVGGDVVQSKKSSTRQSKPAASGRKRQGTPTKVEESPNQSPTSSSKVTKRAKLRSASSESDSSRVMSPTVLVSPLKTPISQQASDHDLALRVRLTSPKNSEQKQQQTNAKTEQIAEEKNKKPESAATNQPATNGVVAPSQPTVKPKAVPRPQPTKRELATTQRCQLLKRLDHYDLSDLTTLGSLLSGWPEVDVHCPNLANDPVTEKMAAAHRIWVSERIPGVGNGNNHHTNNNHPDENGETDQATIAKKMRNDDADSVVVKNTASKTNTVGETNSEVTANDADIDSFCVASFVLPTANPSTGKPNEVQLQQDEHERILREVATINPDVFCVKNARPDYASSKLKPELARQGYLSSPCPEGDAFAYQSFVFYNRNVFSELSFHHIPVQAMAKKLVSRSAYPQSWRDSLTRSLENNAYSTEGSSVQASPELIISALSHKSTGSFLLVGCLTDKPSTSKNSKTSSPLVPVLLPINLQTPITNTHNDWNRVPHVLGANCASTTTVSVSKLGCAMTTSSYSGEWCPPSFDSRPDLATINAAGSLWALQEVWNEAMSAMSGVNGDAENLVQIQNGYASSTNGSSPDSRGPTSAPQPFRWVLCTNLEAAPTSPVYQIFRDGYPSDESLARLKTVRNIHLQDHDYMDGTSLIDLLWHAFQHPCTDVLSCYNSVLGREPPFTRFTETSESVINNQQLSVVPRKCIDYIFCSMSSLKPKSVLMPPCRAIASSCSSSTALSPHQRPTVAAPWRSGAALAEIAFPLAVRLGLKSSSTITNVA